MAKNMPSSLYDARKGLGVAQGYLAGDVGGADITDETSAALEFELTELATLRDQVRAMAPPLALSSDRWQRWDRRFVVRVRQRCPSRLSVRALGAASASGHSTAPQVSDHGIRTAH